MPAMILATLGVVVGLAVLTYASDHFVIGAARIAAALRLSPIVVGAVVIGFGTSTPELLVSTLAAARGSIDLAVGNIVGSNVVNITLVLGVAALVATIPVRATVLRREAPLSLAATVLFALFVQGGLTALEGAMLAVLLVVSLVMIVRSARSKDPVLTAQADEYVARTDVSVPRESLRTLVALVAVLGAAQLLVVNATGIARELGISEGFIGLTVIAVGTSLPELATSIQAARKGETDLLVGNLLGSNLFNAAAVGAATAFAGAGQAIDPSVGRTGVVVMVVVGALATVLMATSRRIVRWEGVVLVLAYFAILPLLAG